MLRLEYSVDEDYGLDQLHNELGSGQIFVDDLMVSLRVSHPRAVIVLSNTPAGDKWMTWFRLKYYGIRDFKIEEYPDAQETN